MQPQWSITQENDVIIVTGPYNSEMVSRFRAVGGVFTRGVGWVLDATPPTMALLQEQLFWHPGCGTTRVTVTGKEATEVDNSAIWHGYVLATRWSRDEPVKQAPSVRLLSGNYTWRGGSRNNPRVDISPQMSWEVCVYDGASPKS